MVMLLLLGSSMGAASAAQGADRRLEVTTDSLRVVFSTETASPVEWHACHPSCTDTGGRFPKAVAFTTTEDPPQLRARLRGAGSTLDLDRLRYTASLHDEARARVVRFESEPDGEGTRIVRSFGVARRGYEVDMHVRVDGPNAGRFAAERRLEVTLVAGRGLSPRPAAGFTGRMERVRSIVVAAGDVRELGNGASVRLEAAEWAGLRSRFWAIVGRSEGGLTVEAEPGGRRALVYTGDLGAVSSRVLFYSGPIEYSSLTQVDSELGRMVFSGLWFWLRAMSLALMFLLRGLTAVLDHPGAAIIALAACVKVLLLPITLVADRLQGQVNAVQARLQPRIASIKAAHRGEEQASRLLELYREERVHPLYPVKSLLGVLIQLPVFIAVFDMLAEDFDLHGRSFLWIADLSRPDELLALPRRVPFFGQHLNLLPFLMSGVAIAASLRFDSAVLPPALVRRQRRNLVGMAILFFLLFYTFPAGMVLYWTSTNVLQLVFREVRHLLRPRPGSGATPEPAGG